MSYKAQEKYNIKNIKLLLELNEESLEEIINDGERCKDGSEWYASYIVKTLKIMSRCPSGTKVIYKYAKNCRQGRQYAKPHGIQNLPKTIRDLVIEDTGLIDYDIINAHFSILFNLCSKHSITCPLLTKIVNDRKEFLSSVGLNKIELIIFLNMDKPYTNNNPILEDLSKELYNIKTTIITHYQSFIEDVKKKDDNILSSKANKILCWFENDAVMKVVKTFNLKNASLIFDGLMTTQDLPLDKLYEITGLKWSIKPYNKIDISDYKIESEYDINKKDMELNNFMTLDPVAFYSRISTNHTYKSHPKPDFVDINAVYDIDNKPFVNQWLRDKERRTFDSVVFDPNPNFNNNKVYNIFEPFAMTGLEPADGDEEDIDFFHEILLNCSGDSDINGISYNYLLNYLAQLIQQPHINPQVSIVIKGFQGSGKDTLTHILELIFGLKHNYLVKIGNIDRVTGTFTECLENKLLVQLNEMDGRNGSKYNNQLKDLITTEQNAINKKYRNVIFQENYIRFLVYSQSLTPVVVEATDRRFCVFTSGWRHRGDADWWANSVYKPLKNPKVVATIYKLLKNHDINNFVPRNIPNTDARKNMMMFSGCGVSKFLKYEFLPNNIVADDKRHTIKGVSYEVHPCSRVYDIFQDSEYYQRRQEDRENFKKKMLASGICIKRRSIITGDGEDNKKYIRDCYCIKDRKSVLEWIDQSLPATDEEDDEE